MKEMMEISYPITEYAGGTWSRWSMSYHDLRKSVLNSSNIELLKLKYRVIVDGRVADEGELIPFIQSWLMPYNERITNVVIPGEEQPHTVTIIIDTDNFIDEYNENNNTVSERVPVMRTDEIDLVPTRLFFCDEEGVLYSNNIALQGYRVSGKGLIVSIKNAGREAREDENYSVSFILRCEEKGTEVPGGPVSFNKGMERNHILDSWGWTEEQYLEVLNTNEEPKGALLNFTVRIDSDNVVPESDDDNNNMTVELELPK